MKYDKSKLDDLEIHQLVDGELTDSQSRVVAERIANDDLRQKKTHEYREINRKLHQTFDEKPLASIPTRLLLAAGTRNRAPIWGVAASLLWLSVGGMLGYSLQNQVSDSEFVRPLAVEAAFAHAVYVPEVRHPVEVAASEQDHLNAWLSKRLDKPIVAPDLRAEGYTLIGGRLLPDGHRAAAQFMFENSTGERITLYIRQAPDTAETALLHAEINGLGIVYWMDNGLAYALTAEADKAQLIVTATAVYKAANP
jgi:anti-sigma factor RsiW